MLKSKAIILMLVTLSVLFLFFGCKKNEISDGVLEKTMEENISSSVDKSSIPSEVEESTKTPMDKASSAKFTDESEKKDAEENQLLGDKEKKVDENEDKVENDSTRVIINHDEIIGVWVAFLDFNNILENKDEKAARESIDAALKNIKNSGINTVFLHVRPFADSIYPSKIFPWSHVFNGGYTQGTDPGYDPLMMFIELGHNYGLSIHGWINPYRISNTEYPKSISANSILYTSGLSDNDFVKLETGTFINPASEAGRNVVVEGVTEVLENYDLDGIQFDDYFYPSTEASVDSYWYENYKNSGGLLPLEDFRRENVDLLIKKVYDKVKSIDKNIVFGISPQSNIEANYNQHFVDAKKWASAGGYVDYLMPQVYFGFNNDVQPYSQTILKWQNIVEGTDVKLLIGLVPYKIGAEDTYAGSGRHEWMNDTDILKRQYQEAKNLKSYGGIALYRYNYLFHSKSPILEKINQEMASLKSEIYK